MRLIAAVVFFCYAMCAVAGTEMKTRIANRGELAAEGEFPHQVSLRMNGRHFCGGSLVSKTHVLTAAHCIQPQVDSGRFSGPVTVEVGMVHLGAGQTHIAKRISYHSGFQMESTLFLVNDIAMVHLGSPVELSDKVATIKLPQPYSSLPPGTTVIASGFGVDDAIRGQISPVLKKMDAQIVSNENCQMYHRAQLHDGKICAAKGPGYGTCKGDSGGPLVDETKTTLIGVVSGGDGKCQKGTPDVYTDVSRCIPYINEEINWKPGTPNPNPAVDLEKQAAGGMESWLGQQQLHSPLRPPSHFGGFSSPQQLRPPQNFGGFFDQQPNFGSDLEQPGGMFLLPGFYSNKKK